MRIPNIPMEYYYEDFIWKIGNRTGNPLKIDITTVADMRGRFVRLCVELISPNHFFLSFAKGKR